MKPPSLGNERKRLRALRDYRILDTLKDDRYDEIARLAAEVCETPMAAISFVDRFRQWFKATVGIEVWDTPRDDSFCAHAIVDGDAPLIVEDAAKDDRFADNPLVTGHPHLRFYAGIPLVTRGGDALGTLCVLDRIPRVLRSGQVDALRILGRHTVGLLEAHRERCSSDQLGQSTENLRSALSALERVYLLLNGLHLGVFTATGFLGRITEGNQALAEMIDAQNPAALGEVHLRDLFESPAEYDEIAERMLHENRIVVQQVRLKSLRGRPLFASLTAAAERVNRRIAITGAIQDVTELRLAERDRDRFFNLALDMLCIAGNDGYFKLINPAFERTLGYSREELLARPYLDLVHPDDVARTISEAIKLSRGENTARFENRYLCKNGEYIHVSWVATALREEGLVYAIARDITARVRAENSERALLASRVEIDLARSIQNKLLPATAPQVEGFDLAGFVQQFDAVGGDYYDYIPGGDDTLFLVVGDVSGHGVAPSLIMAEVRTCLWSILPGCTEIGSVIDRLNTLLHASVPDGYFATLSVVALNTRTGEVRHVNCAHPSGFILAPSGEILARLESSGLPLGCFAECLGEVAGAGTLPPGGTLILMTDGILEASSPAGEMFGEERVLDVVRVNHHKSAAGLVDQLQLAIRAFCSGEAGQDDITFLIVRRSPLAAPRARAASRPRAR